MLEIIAGEFGYLIRDNSQYKCFGVNTWQGFCYKADPNCCFSQEPFEKLPSDFPLYSGKYALKADSHDNCVTKEDLKKLEGLL